MDIEVEIKKQLNILRYFQNYLAESSANPKDFGKIIDIWKNPLHRILKLNCYPLLKTFPAQDLVILELEKDFSNKDYEIQLASLKLAYCLPINNLMQIVKSHDSIIYQIIENSSEFHYERLCAINSILELLLTKETEIDTTDMPKIIINNIYVRIAENCFSINRDISANCIICLGQFFQKKLQNPNNLTYVDYDTNQIKQYLLPRVQLLHEKIYSYEIRIRTKMLILLLFVMENAPLSIQQFNTVQQNQNTIITILDTKEFNKKCIQTCLYEIFQYNFELDIIILCSEYIIGYLQKCKFSEYFNKSQIVWQLFDGIDKFIKKVSYKKELNQILLNLLKINVDLNTKIAISIRILELSFLVQNQITRFLFMLYCFDNLIIKSIELIEQKKGSAILGLYNQSWFLTKLKDEPEELICTLIIAAIHSEKNKQILLEIMDICNGCIWDGCNIEAIIMYLLLVEECTNVIPYEEIRLQDLINRMNTNQISFVQKIQTLLIVTKKFNETNLLCKLDYINIIAEFRTFMIQPAQTPIYQLNLLQSLYKILYYLSQNFHSNENNIKSQILELLSDYGENLQQKKNEQLVQQLQEFNKNFIQSLKYNEKLTSEQLQFKFENKVDSSNLNFNLISYQMAYNIFQLQALSLEQINLIDNLRCLQIPQKNIFTELQYNSKLITGVSDFVQIYCSHAIDLSKQCICLGIRVINNCPFKLDNLGVKILLDRNAYIQNNYKVIEELPSYHENQLFYVVKVNPKNSMHFAFDIILQNIQTDAGIFAIRTQNYRISMLEFVIPNKFLFLSSICQQYIQYDSSITIKCNLDGSYLLLFKKLLQQPFATVILESGNQVFVQSIKQNLDQITQCVSKNISIGLLGYLVSGQNIGITISNISTISERSETILDIKCQGNSILNAELDKFVNELSGGLLSIIL